MIKPIDILTGADGDLMVFGGDLVMGNATEAHTRDLVVADKGFYKWDPTMGVGVRNYLNDNNAVGLKGSVRRELTKDGQLVQALAVLPDGSVSIESQYE